METSAQFLTLVAALSVAAKFVAEWLFGARLDARRMQGAAIGLTVAMLTVCWAVASFAPDLGGPEVAFLADQGLLTVLVAGVLAGFGSNGFHDLLSRPKAPPAP